MHKYERLFKQNNKKFKKHYIIQQFTGFEGLLGMILLKGLSTIFFKSLNNAVKNVVYFRFTSIKTCQIVVK